MSAKDNLAKIIILLLLMLGLSYKAEAFVIQPDRWSSEYSLGSTALKKQRYVDAEQHLIDSLDHTQGNVQKLLLSLEALESVYDQIEDYTKEESVLLAQCAVLKGLRPNAVPLGKIYTKLGALNSLVGCFDESEIYYEQAIPLLKAGLGQLNTPAAMALNNLAWSEFQQCKFSESENHFRQSLYIHSKVTGNKSIFYGLAATNLAELYATIDRPAAAVIWYERALIAFRASLGDKHPFTTELERRYSTIKKRTVPPKPSPAKPSSPRLSPDVAYNSINELFDSVFAGNPQGSSFEWFYRQGFLKVDDNIKLIWQL